MRRALMSFLILSLSWVSLLFGVSKPLSLEDVHHVMQKMFGYHVEHKQFTPALVRRCMKMYIEQFDPEKCYLLESEARMFLSLSDAQVHKIIKRIENQDYSDFFVLNETIQKAIVRSQEYRKQIASQIAHEELEDAALSFGAPSAYANSEEVLFQRQKARMLRFYTFHKQKTFVDSVERRKKVCSLFEAKLRRMEGQYVQAEATLLSNEQKEHLVSLRILKAFAKSLDTHTAFFSQEEAYEMRRSLEKQFEGVGVILSEGVDGVMIAEVVKGSPAAESGRIQVNDLLVEIDGENVRYAPFEEVIEKLKNKDKGEINLGFLRMNFEESQETFFQVSLQKKPIVMNEERIQVGYERYGDGIIGKIALYSFYETADGVSSEKDIKEAIRALSEIGPIYGLVLDLRENSGGFLSQAVKVAGLFVANGVIVVSKYAKGEVHFLRNIVSRSFYSGPLVVLTSKMSASASEIVAQALQDYGVGLVVGDERTFGKGSIQYQTVTDAKAEYFFKVTVGRYYTASGRSTQIDGVIADIVVPTQYAPYNIGERYLEFPLPPDRVSAVFVDPLTDLDEKTRRLFQRKYMPYLQRVVPFWKKALPILRKNSAARMAKDPAFQAFLKKQEQVRSRQQNTPANTIDEPVHIGLEDLQMNEAVNIIRDMIWLEAESRPPQENLLEKTG